MKLTADARALVELGRKLTARREKSNSTEMYYTDPTTRIDQIESAIESIATHKTLTKEQKTRGISALNRAKSRITQNPL